MINLTPFSRFQFTALGFTTYTAKVTKVDGELYVVTMWVCEETGHTDATVYSVTDAQAAIESGDWMITKVIKQG